jgi:glutathione synthase/RimK-type ligase-like ATP-grasp enzyme
VGNAVHAVSITDKGSPVAGDWRRLKSEATFSVVSLPDDVRARCVRLVEILGLVFGAIDLAVVRDEYFFLEINPTGEWAWLVDTPGIPVDEVVAQTLTGSE